MFWLGGNRRCRSVGKPSSSFRKIIDARAIGFELGQTRFEDDIEIDLGRDGLTCGTGDSFVSGMPESQTDIVDMELHVIAKIGALSASKSL